MKCYKRSGTVEKHEELFALLTVSNGITVSIVRYYYYYY